jgi:hypothetical protein
MQIQVTKWKMIEETGDMSLANKRLFTKPVESGQVNLHPLPPDSDEPMVKNNGQLVPALVVDESQVDLTPHEPTTIPPPRPRTNPKDAPEYAAIKRQAVDVLKTVPRAAPTAFKIVTADGDEVQVANMGEHTSDNPQQWASNLKERFHTALDMQHIQGDKREQRAWLESIIGKPVFAEQAAGNPFREPDRTPPPNNAEIHLKQELKRAHGGGEQLMRVDKSSREKEEEEEEE